MGDIYLLYPEKRWISAAKLAQWYGDEVANMAVRPGCRTVNEMAEELEDAGFITRAAVPDLVVPDYPGPIMERAFGDGNDAGG